MRRTTSDRATAILLLLLLLCSFGAVSTAQAQEPPLDVPQGGRPTQPPTAIAVGDWLLYPTLRTATAYTDNLFMSPTSPLTVPSFAVTPGLTAEWTNGIHKTTLFGSFTSTTYPTQPSVNSFDALMSIDQRYEMMRDLIFGVNGNYTHQTIAPSLVSGLPTTTPTPSTVVLPNGNIQLPNGTILSPQGQPIGQAAQTPSQTSTTSGLSVVNPYDTFTATASVDKYFNRGVASLHFSIAKSDYEKNSANDYSVKSFSGSAAFWLGPLFYVYSNGSLAENSTVTGITTVYRAVGGVGVRVDKSFGGSVYYGQQGSTSSGSAAGGAVFGTSLSYNPSVNWSLTATFDETINNAPQGANAPTNFAQSLPGDPSLQIPLTASTITRSFGLTSNYAITQQWSLATSGHYSLIDYIGSTRVDQNWTGDVALSYTVSLALSLTWDYQITNVVSNAPGVNVLRNQVVMSALYKF